MNDIKTFKYKLKNTKKDINVFIDKEFSSYHKKKLSQKIIDLGLIFYFSFKTKQIHVIIS